MKLLEFIKRLFCKPSYIAIHVDGLSKKREKIQGLIAKNQVLKKICFVELENFPNFLLSKDLSSSGEIRDLEKVYIYDIKNNDIKKLQSRTQTYLTYFGILKPLIIKEAEPQVTEEKAEELKNVEGVTGEGEDRSVETEASVVGQHPILKDNDAIESDNTNEEASDTEENVSPGEETNTILKTIESLKTEIQELIENKIKEATNQIGVNSKKIESITQTIVDENKIKDIINSIITEELKSYITEVRFQSELNTKLSEYAKNVNLKTINSSLVESTKKIESIEKKLDSIDNEKVSNKTHEELRSEIKEIKDSMATILSVYQSSEAGHLQQKIDSLESELGETQEELKKKEQALVESENENEKIKTDNENKKVRIESLEKDVANKKVKIDEQKKELADTQKSLQKTSKALDSANEKIVEQEKTIKDSEAIIEKKDEIINKNEEELEEKGRKIDEQSTQIDGLLQDKCQLEGDLRRQKDTNNELEKTIHDDNDKLKSDFLNALSSIKVILEERGYIIPCGDNEDDCEELEDMLNVKVNKFTNSISSKIDGCLNISSTISMLTEQVENELLNERSWIYDIARYRAYSRKRFMKDESREHGVRLEKGKIVVMWENLNMILSMLGFSLIMPDLFEDSVSDNDEYIDNTGQTISNLEFLIPNNDKYLTEISNNDGRIIRDYAEIGYKYNGNVIKKTKIIR